MCFSIPLKVISTTKTHAVLEDGQKVRIGRGVVAATGEYVRVLGSVIVDTLTHEEGQNVRRLIKELNTQPSQ